MSKRTSARERARERLIFALDVGSLREAGEYLRVLEGTVGMFKVGKQLFLKAGPRIVKYIRDRGGEVFLDLKFHDIPQTVARASMEATRHGVVMFNVHASGSREMMRQTVAAVNRVCRTEKLRRPHILGVTVLTSLSAADLRTIGVRSRIEDQVVRLASLAEGAGMDGVVASPLEIAAIRKACSRRFLIVTPGIRSAGDEIGDQHRVSGPAEAIERGADYIVVGRPIRDAADPRAAAEGIVGEIAAVVAPPQLRSTSRKSR
ncbi:MAG: orotidine-5'-phosphate decarboxylase [Deltaproteobacteria bacterium]